MPKKPLLEKTLLEIIENDTNYELRYRLIFRALDHAVQRHMKVGIKIDPQEPEYPVVYINLPTGQVSWHMPQYPEEWDGHTTEEKFNRIKEFVGE